MTNGPNSTDYAARVEHHADLILRASGSALRNYTMPANRKAILSAVMDAYEEAFRAGAAFALDHARNPLPGKQENV